MQDAVKSKTATVLAIDAARSRHPSMAYCDQNVVLQTPEEDRCPPVPGENPLIDLLQRYTTLPVHSSNAFRHAMHAFCHAVLPSM